MSATGDLERPLPPEGDLPRQSRRRDAAAVREICPFLAADAGAWRNAYPSRDHRCGAVSPPALLAPEKQRKMCLLAVHRTCATYGAALAVTEAAAPSPPGDTGAALWSPAASAPLVLEPVHRIGRLRPRVLPSASAYGGSQGLLIGLMVVALLVLVIARTQTPAGGGAPLPDPSLVAVAGTLEGSPSPTPATSPAVPRATGASSVLSASPTLPSTVNAPDATVTATKAPSRRYSVRSGDTLSSIAAKFDTTVRKLTALNSISDARLLRIGQVLLIP